MNDYWVKNTADKKNQESFLKKMDDDFGPGIVDDLELKYKINIGEVMIQGKGNYTNNLFLMIYPENVGSSEDQKKISNDLLNKIKESGFELEKVSNGN